MDGDAEDGDDNADGDWMKIMWVVICDDNDHDKDEGDDDDGGGGGGVQL